MEIWDLSSHTQIAQLSGHQPVENIATATVDGQTVVITAGIEDKVRIWDLTTRAEIGQLKAASSTSWVKLSQLQPLAPIPWPLLRATTAPSAFGICEAEPRLTRSSDIRTG